MCVTNLSISRAGDYPYTISPPRWGDYSGASVDPDDSTRMASQPNYATTAAGSLNYCGNVDCPCSP